MMEGRIGRFLRAARTLMWMQVAAALFALTLAIWAVLAVRDLAAERDRLQERVSALESRPPELPALSAAPPAELPLDPATPATTPPTVDTNQAPSVPGEPGPLPPPVVTTRVPPPTTSTPTPAPQVTPTPTSTPPVTDRPNGPEVEEGPRVRPRPRPLDCNGAAANTPRCRPGRWVPPADILPNRNLQRPVTNRDVTGNRQRPIN